VTARPPLEDKVAQRNLLVTVAMVFAVFTGFAFVLPFLPLFVRDLGVEEPEAAALWAGVLIGIAPLLAGLLAPVWGRLADRHGQKGIAVKALVAYVILLALSAAVRNAPELLALRIGVGLFGGIGPLGLAMATAQAPREDTGRAVGLIQAAQILSAAIGPLAGGILADAIGIRRTFLVTAALCVLALVLLLAFYEERAPREHAPTAARAGFRNVIAIPGVVGLLGVLFVVNFIGRSFTPILPMHLGDLGLPPSRLASATGVLISAYSLAAATSAWGLGRLSRSHAPQRLLLATLVGGALIVAPMALVPSFELMLALAVLLGLVGGGSLTLCYTIGGLMVPQEVRTTSFGFFSGAALFGGALSPTVAGLVAHATLRGIYVSSRSSPPRSSARPAARTATPISSAASTAGCTIPPPTTSAASRKPSGRPTRTRRTSASSSNSARSPPSRSRAWSARSRASRRRGRPSTPSSGRRSRGRPTTRA
jgi:MFS transporter, DHA1 family, multidrug resistance protein